MINQRTDWEIRAQLDSAPIGTSLILALRPMTRGLVWRKSDLGFWVQQAVRVDPVEESAYYLSKEIGYLQEKNHAVWWLS